MGGNFTDITVHKKGHVNSVLSYSHASNNGFI